MQVHYNKHDNRWPRRSALVLALAALGCPGARADEPSPWYIGASEALTHDSNVNRLSDGINDPDGRADTYSSTSLLGGFDQSYGRQHFYTKANVAYNKYEHHDDLNNTSYGINAGWDWASIWNLSGGFYASANQSLAQLNGNSQAPTLGKNEIRTQQYGTTVNWGGPGDLSVQGALTHSRVSYSLAAAGNTDSSANTGSLGVYYHVGPTLTTGIAYRVTSTDSALLNGSPYTSDGHNIDLSVDWRYTVQTGVKARLSFTRQSNSGGTGQDFSGLTGSVSATYAPTAKLNFNASYDRDAGTNGSFFNVPIQGGTPANPNAPANSFYQNSTVTNSYGLGARYLATAKITVNANYVYRSSTTSNSGAAVASGYKDNLQTASLGAAWAIGRVWSVGCNLSHEKRDVQTVPPYTYSDNTVGCSVQATLQ